MAHYPHAIIEVAFAPETADWHVTAFWPGQPHKGQETYGPYGSFIEARTCADGAALKLTEYGGPAPQVIVMAGTLWGKATAF